MKKLMAVACVWLAATGAAAPAEEIELYNAMASGPNVWVWEGAKLTVAEGKLLLARDKGDFGDVYLGDRFAYLPDGQLKIDVAKVIAGSYSVQALAFKGDAFLKATDLVKDESSAEGKLFKLGKVSFPDGTDRVTFKLWISKKPGSAISFSNLTYTLPVETDAIAYDRTLDESIACTADLVDWTPGPDGGVLTLHTNTPTGSLLLPDLVAKPDRGTLVLTTSPVKNGTLTIQLCAFDADGNYLGAVDVIKKAVIGMSTSLEGVEWPEGTTAFRVKIWIGGLAGASTTVKRVLVLK